MSCFIPRLIVAGAGATVQHYLSWGQKFSGVKIAPTWLIIVYSRMDESVMSPRLVPSGGGLDLA
jgi:hypothetical protein